MRNAAIRCTICGKAAPPGALLCAPCRAALKRAGHLTVQDLPHYLAPVRRPGGKGRRAADARRPAPIPPAPAATPAPTSGRRVLLAVAAVAALAGVAYFGQSRPDPEGGGPTARRVGGSEPSSAAMTSHAVPETRRATASLPAAAASASSAPTPTVMEPARPVAARTPVRTKQAVLRAEATMPESALPVAETVVTVPALPPPVPAPREAPPPPDRWQQMSDALARCDREGGFSGFICDQRVRLDSCEGWWGKVPQCPNPPENPR